MHITESDNMYHIDQDLYMNKIEQIPSNAEFSKFASMKMKLVWLANTRPNKVLEISQISQVTRTMYEKDTSILKGTFSVAQNDYRWLVANAPSPAFIVK